MTASCRMIHPADHIHLGIDVLSSDGAVLPVSAIVNSSSSRRAAYPPDTFLTIV